MNDEAESGSREGRGAKWLAVSVVLLVLGAAATLVLLMKQAARPAQLEAAAGSAEAPVRPGQEAPELPPPHRRLGEMPVVSEDRLVLNGLVPSAKRCLGDGHPPGYLTVLLEVAPAGQPLRAAAASFGGQPLPTGQRGCIESGLLALRFARSASTRLLQRRFYLGGGAPRVEAAIAPRPDLAALAQAISALGDLRLLCPEAASALAPGLTASFSALLSPDGRLHWVRANEGAGAPLADCLVSQAAPLSLSPFERAVTLVLAATCKEDACTLTPRIAGEAELVE